MSLILDKFVEFRNDVYPDNTNLYIANETVYIQKATTLLKNGVVRR